MQIKWNREREKCWAKKEHVGKVSWYRVEGYCSKIAFESSRKQRVEMYSKQLFSSCCYALSLRL